MATNQAQRPRFYEQQYLGAADLTAVVEYGRLQVARHDLGGHSWGIAIGLQLRDQTSPSNPGQVDVVIQPGFAWDGFGRPIVLHAPEPVAADLFKDLLYDPALDDPAANGTGTPGRLVPVWLRYLETATQPPRPGFELCEGDDQYSRIQEGFRVAAGERPNAADQRDPVTVAGRQIDAQEVLHAFDPAAGQIYDTSVPHQTFPESGRRAFWYVPLGVVRWLPNTNPNQPGRFVERTAADREQSRRRRRYVGLVAESVQAADGILRLRDRTRDYSSVWSTDLVWIEGSLRVEGDAKLFGGKLEWRNAAGQDSGAPLEIRRASGASGASMLQVAIGQDTNGLNRFGVGPLQAGAAGAPPAVAEKLVVLDNGRVGIGTTTPALTLDIQGDFGRPNGPATLSLFSSQIGDVGNGILFLRSGGGIVAFDGGDQVGVGTPTPRNSLGVRGVGPAQELLSFEDAGGQTKWHLNQNFLNRPGLNFVETGVEDGRLFLAAGGNVGIGTTTPGLRLDIQGDFGRANGPATLSLFGSRIGDVGNGILFLRSGGATVAFDGADNVGVGTSTPASRLHVVGSQNADAAFLTSHVAVIENTDAGASADVLALHVATATPTGSNNFVTFSGGTGPVGSIEGDGAGGVLFKSGSADFAECLPRLDEDEMLRPGDVVGIVGGRVTRTTAGAHHIRAISTRPIVVGNAPPPGERERFALVAFLGQAAVRVRGPVRAGDLIVPSGQDDGIGVAVSAGQATAAEVAMAVGTAWESSDQVGIKLINTGLGLPNVLLATSREGPASRVRASR